MLASSPAAASELEFTPCSAKIAARQIDALCASLSRPENPAKPDAKQINLQIIKLPARRTDPQADAFTIIQGGPGGSSINLAVGYAGILEQIRSERDVLVVDQRGTGRSNMLTCPELDPAILAGGFDLQVIKQQALDCIASNDADLRYYTTSIAVQDLDAVRAAAGYPQLTVYGVSYGTRVALHYLRRFPERNRALVLDGVVPIGLSLAGGEIARQSQAAFDNLANRCAEAKHCSAQFGDLKRKLNELLLRLDKGAIELRLPHPSSGELVDKILSRDDVLGVLRLMAYSTEDNAILPLLISSAHAGDYTPLAAQSIMLTEQFVEGYAVAMNNTVMCAEDAPFVTSDDLSNLEGTYFGTQLTEAMRETCSVWPRGPIDEDFRTSFDSQVPVLILSGETDPITPPANGEAVQSMLSNSKHLVVPAHGHGVFPRGCVPQLVSDFVAQGSSAELNTKCIKRETAMPFFNSASGPTP